MTRLQIIGGGEPGPEEIAAIVLALTPVARPSEADARHRVSGWLRAAMAEGVGRRRFVSADDLDAAPFGSP